MSKLDLLLQDYYRGQSVSVQKATAIKQAAHNLKLDNNLKPDESFKVDENKQLNQNQQRVNSHSSIHSLVTKTKTAPSLWSRSGFLRQGVAALFCLVLLSSVTYYHFNNRDTQYNIANEIALNHHKPFKADVLNTNFTMLSESLSGANFSIHVPQHISQQFDLLGARYCSISKQLAVHLQLVDKQTEQLSSLFITPSTKWFSQLQNNVVLTAHDNAHHARYWSSDSLFYALLSNDVVAM